MDIFSPIFALLSVPQTVTAIFGYLKNQRRFLTAEISPIILTALAENDGSLKEKDFSKINHYYGLAVPAILGEAFCRLHGKEMTLTERRASTAQGAMTGLFDDFYDENFLNDDGINTLLTNPQHSTLKSNEKLFTSFYHLAINNVPDADKMKQALAEVQSAQQKSKLQLSNAISQEEIEQITFEKGGSSLLFYRTAFLPQPNEYEHHVIHQLGALMQLCNDVFDVYKDRESGVNTLITKCRDIRYIRSFFITHLRQAFEEARQLNLPMLNIHRFLSLISMGIFSRAMVCLDQLEALQQLSGGQFKVDQYSRNQLICDMDLKMNMWRSGIYFWKIMKF